MINHSHLYNNTAWHCTWLAPQRVKKHINVDDSLVWRRAVCTKYCLMLWTDHACRFYFRTISSWQVSESSCLLFSLSRGWDNNSASAKARWWSFRHVCTSRYLHQTPWDRARAPRNRMSGNHIDSRVSQQRHHCVGHRWVHMQNHSVRARTHTQLTWNAPV